MHPAQDLLWRLYVKEESKHLDKEFCGSGQTTQNYKLVPPHMKSLTKTLSKSDIGKQRVEEYHQQQKMYREALQPPTQEEFDARRRARLRKHWNEKFDPSNPSTARSDAGSVQTLPTSPVDTSAAAAAQTSPYPSARRGGDVSPTRTVSKEILRQNKTIRARERKTEFQKKAYEEVMTGLIKVRSSQHTKHLVVHGPYCVSCAVQTIQKVKSERSMKPPN